MNDNPLRRLPSVDALLQTSRGAALRAGYGHGPTVEAIRHVLDEIRLGVMGGEEPPDWESILERVEAELVERETPTLRPVINATGVIIHTNLGRALLSEEARDAMLQVAAGYSTLEYDLEPGRRGSRFVHAEKLLSRITGAEAAMVVNNNAAAVMLILAGLARGREVIISRGQLVEIGGGFRIPDVMRQSGAKLVEVGTTNRTHLRDYRDAISEETAMILRAHHSNFKIVGFTSEPPIGELVELGHEHGLIVAEDLGSGALLDTADYGLDHEPMAQESIAAGVDVVSFSGDKLLGGPQAGIIIGRGELVERLKRHPFTRAVRPDKLCLAALSATLGHYLRGEAVEKIPVWRMIAMPIAEISGRAERWAASLPDGMAEVIAGESTVGGGSLPGATLPTRLLAINTSSPDALAARLRACDPPVIARIEGDRVVLDPRTVLPEQDRDLLEALTKVLATAA